MALPSDSQITNTSLTVAEYRALLDNVISDVAKGLTEFVGSRSYLKGAQVLASDGFPYISQKNANSGNDPTVDDGTNWRMDDAILNTFAAMYSGGDESVFCRLIVGVNVSGFSYGIYSGSSGYSVWSIGSVTGTMTGAFNPVSGTATGLSGVLVRVNAITENRVSGIESDITALEGRATSLEGRATALEDSEFGVGQTWQTFTVPAQRALSTTYTNSTDKPIEISVVLGGQNCVCEITVSSVIAHLSSVNGPQGTTNNVCGVVVVPVGATYSVRNTGFGSLTQWRELR